MIFGNKKDPVHEFFTSVIKMTAHSVGRPLAVSQASDLAHELLNGNGITCEEQLGVFVLVPIAYNAVRNWRGCSAGTCHSFFQYMRPFGWESLLPVDMLLQRPQSLFQAHFRMWEGVLRPEGIIPSAIQRECNDAEKHLSHMILHATTDLVYAQSGQNQSFAGRPSPLPLDVKTVLQGVVRLANQLETTEYFVTKEVDGLNRAVRELL